MVSMEIWIIFKDTLSQISIKGKYLVKISHPSESERPLNWQLKKLGMVLKKTVLSHFKVLIMMEGIQVRYLPT